MKHSLRRIDVLLAAVLAVLVAIAGWSYCQFASSCGDAAATASDLNACRNLAQQVKKVHAKPSVVGTKARTSTETAHAIENAAKGAGLSLANIVQIDPQPPRRLPDLPYQEQPTHVTLRNVTVRQLLIFLYGLADDAIGMSLSELRLSAPREETTSGTSETWLAEVTLIQRSLVPQAAPHTARAANRED